MAKKDRKIAEKDKEIRLWAKLCKSQQATINRLVLLINRIRDGR